MSKLTIWLQCTAPIHSISKQNNPHMERIVTVSHTKWNKLKAWWFLHSNESSIATSLVLKRFCLSIVWNSTICGIIFVPLHVVKKHIELGVLCWRLDFGLENWMASCMDWLGSPSFNSDSRLGFVPRCYSRLTTCCLVGLSVSRPWRWSLPVHSARDPLTSMQAAPEYHFNLSITLTFNCKPSRLWHCFFIKFRQSSVTLSKN